MSKKILIENKEAKIKILICCHKPWQLPKSDIFFPIQSGKAISGINLEMQGDDTGDNISHKNVVFGEFTAWYWAWKNIKTIYPNIEYIGLAHYRRFFALNEPYTMYPTIGTPVPKLKNYDKLIIKKLDNSDIILLKPTSFVCNLKEHYIQSHHESDYFHMKNCIHELCPEYDESFLQVFENNNTLSLFCMFISRYDFFNKYFEWLFPLLLEVEKRINISDYNMYQSRVLAFLAERLLNVYVYHHKLKVVYEPVYLIKKEKNVLKRMIKLILNGRHGIVRYGIKEIKKRINGLEIVKK
ncbi:MAG: DUF4422 domain-containing protein [Bacteroidales bacterium]|jgi:hypothetical protein|nr:DUF4422 domain-containing protein [Bacteroidales bacterium]